MLGHDDLAPYVARRQFFGATVGRYANRIAGARFALDGTEVRLEANDGANCLHGGVDGFDRRLWRIADLADQVEPTLALTRESPDGEDGFPGRLDVRATFRVSGESELTISYEATTDRPWSTSPTTASSISTAPYLQATSWLIGSGSPPITSSPSMPPRFPCKGRRALSTVRRSTSGTAPPLARASG